METLGDVINWFENNRFIYNPLITIVVIGGSYDGYKILAILIANNKNDAKRGYTTKKSFIKYLKDN